MSNPVFCFGSNLAGRHGAGAALYAVRTQGAVWGCGIGHHGDSYAIPTKGCHLEVLGLEEIGDYITNFLSYAARHPELTFNVTRIGCGLAGYADDQIAPLFSPVENCFYPTEWKPWLGEAAHYHDLH